MILLAQAKAMECDCDDARMGKAAAAIQGGGQMKSTALSGFDLGYPIDQGRDRRLYRWLHREVKITLLRKERRKRRKIDN